MGFAVFFLFLLYVFLSLFVSAFFLPLPITDIGTVRYRTLPYMTIMLIIVNSLIFIILQAPNLYQGQEALEIDWRNTDAG